MECGSSLPDRRMTIRLSEHDVQIALGEGEAINKTFPNIAVMYLRTYKRTPEKIWYVIKSLHGAVECDVPMRSIT